MKKIIVPTDFSDGAFNALSHALHYAKKLGYSIEVVHAFMMPPTGTAVMVDITDILKKNALEEMAKLQKKVDKLDAAKNLRIAYQAEHGSVVDVINRAAANDKNTALVIMGTQGASGITEKWLGSNTAAAARNLSVPLLAIPAGRSYKEIGAITFSTDLKKLSNTQGLGILAEISQAFNTHIKFLHVRKENENVDVNFGKEFRSQVASVFDAQDVRFSFIFDTTVEEGIKEVIKTEQTDMLVLVRHSYGFFENLFHTSVSQQIVNEASLPILILKG
jgi:nucleotide-binding universal stress UspA family protein